MEALWTYRKADWVVERGLLVDHHLRIIDTHISPTAQRFYLIFDTTTFNRGYADYEWRLADELEKHSDLVRRADSEEHAQAILQLCANVRYLPYSIFQRQDCESLQRWIHTGGREEYRWSPQLWTGIATVAFAVVYAAIKSEPTKKRRTYRKRVR